MVQGLRFRDSALGLSLGLNPITFCKVGGIFDWHTIVPPMMGKIASSFGMRHFAIRP